MSNPVDRRRREPSSVDERLVRLLGTPRLAQIVPRLPVDTLHQLIRHRGLEASGELLAAATREQLSSLLDVDLWRPEDPAGDERFDPSRFGEWLETLVETGEALAARIVSGIDGRLVIAGLSGHVRVFDPAARAVPWGGEDEAADEDLAPVTGLTSEVGGYVIAGRRAEAWDAIVTLLRSLEAGHREYFDAVMRGCRRLSSSLPEADGFHDLLGEPQQLVHDLGLARETRRSQRGYLTPADARTVLEVARGWRPDGRDPSSSIRRIAADYLRGDDRGASGGSGARAQEGAPPRELHIDLAEAVVELLAAAGPVTERPRALLGGGTTDGPSAVQPMCALLAHLRDADGPACLARSRELAFLANALMAGCSLQGRAFTPQEASDAAVAVCNLGLEEWQVPGEGESPEAAPLSDTFLSDHDLIPVFLLGWTALHDMSMSAADRLVAVLKDLRCADVETQLGLEVLRRELGRKRAAPWRARDALDVIATLDLPAWVSLLGVLDECPVLPAALRATLEGRTGAVSATAFEFVSTRRQVDEVRAFLEMLADVLVGGGLRGPAQEWRWPRCPSTRR